MWTCFQTCASKQRLPAVDIRTPHGRISWRKAGGRARTAAGRMIIRLSAAAVLITTALRHTTAVQRCCYCLHSQMSRILHNFTFCLAPKVTSSSCDTCEQTHKQKNRKRILLLPLKVCFHLVGHIFSLFCDFRSGQFSDKGWGSGQSLHPDQEEGSGRISVTVF